MKSDGMSILQDFSNSNSNSDSDTSSFIRKKKELDLIFKKDDKKV